MTGIQLVDVPKEVIIYGAGVMGKALLRCLSVEPYLKNVRAFIVRDKAGNPEEIDGVPIVALSEADMYRDEVILVALHEKHLLTAIKELEKSGFRHLIPVSFDGDLWSEIREPILKEKISLNDATYSSLEETVGDLLHLYVVHSIGDKALAENIPYSSFEIPIQVGKAMTDRRIFDVTDADGDNISYKNHAYSELTALYWIWKHDHAQYAGISHYRRRFQIMESQVPLLIASDIDVITTTPVINFNTVYEQYAMDHSREDWNIMLSAVNELYPEYLLSFEKVQNGIWYYAYNMMIARKEILNEYCAWLFPILQYCEDRIGKKEDSYQNRYAGFLSERLMTVFLIHNRYRFHTVIGRKHFIEAKQVG